MPLPRNAVIQVAYNGTELPPDVARQIGNLYVRRYKPSPAVEAQRGFKSGVWKGVLAWILDDTGKVLGWALKALPEGKTGYEVMVFIRKEYRRQGLGDALLDACRKHTPDVPVVYYPHDPTAKAFYQYREEKLARKRGI